MRTGRTLLLLGVLSGGLSCVQAQPGDCSRLQAAFTSATETAHAVDIVERMRTAPGCSAAAGKAAGLLERRLRELIDGSRAAEAADPQVRETELNQRAKIAELWLRLDPNAPKALLARAERLFRERQWEAAARSAEVALYTLIDLKEKQSLVAAEGRLAPGQALYEESDLELAYRIDSDARQLAPVYVERDQTRSGSLCRLTRSARYQPPAEPVEFQVDSDRFTEKGLRAANVIARFVANGCAGDRTINLIGHTDPTLDASYNCRLSEQRAHALRRHIESKAGLGSVKIVAVGLGESAPLRALDPALSREEKFQLLRRVEFTLGNLPAMPDCRARGENLTDY
jgi:outer membrane protein OmpA-like peptidoglycan-associated protein